MRSFSRAAAAAEEEAEERYFILFIQSTKSEININYIQPLA